MVPYRIVIEMVKKNQSFIPKKHYYDIVDFYWNEELARWYAFSQQYIYNESHQFLTIDDNPVLKLLSTPTLLVSINYYGEEDYNAAMYISLLAIDEHSDKKYRIRYFSDTNSDEEGHKHYDDIIDKLPNLKTWCLLNNIDLTEYIH